MRILNEDNDKKIDMVTLYFTQDEAEEMRDSINIIIKNPIDNHVHISSSDCTKEVTICVYDVNNLGDFNERSKKLILEDE